MFDEFRRLCAALAAAPSKEQLQALSDKVDQTDGALLNQLQEFLIFPCQVYLKNPTLSENYTIQVLCFVRQFFSRDQIQLWSSFLLTDILSSLLHLTTSDTGQNKRLSEDLEAAICHCLTAMLRSACPQVRQALYLPEQKLQLSHLVFVSLEWSFKDQAVIVPCLDLLDAVCCNCNSVQDSPSYDSYVLQMSPMLPGITTKAVKILLLQKNAPKAAIIGVLRLWRRFVRAVFCDRQIPDDAARTSGPLSDPIWVARAQDHLLQHLQIFGQSFVTHGSEQVRLELTLLCADLVASCWNRALPNCKSLIIHILTQLWVDAESTEIRRCSSDAIDTLLEIAARSDSLLSQQMVEQSQQELYSACEQLCRPTILRDETRLNRHLAQLHGFLCLIRRLEPASHLFQSETYLQQLLEALLAVVTFEADAPLISVARDGDQWTLPDSFLSESDLFQLPAKTFRHLLSTDLRQRVTDIIGILSGCVNVSAVVDYCLSRLSPAQSGDSRAELIFVLNQIVMGLSSIDHLVINDGQQLLYAVADQYLAMESCLTATTHGLLLEGFVSIATLANVLGLQAEFGRHYLGSILTFAFITSRCSHSGSDGALQATLRDLAKAFDFATVDLLLSHNLGFMSRQVCLLLRRHLTRKSRSPPPPGLELLFREVLRLQRQAHLGRADRDMLDPDLKDIVAILLKQLDVSWMDSTDTNETLNILRIIQILVASLALPIDPSSIHQDAAQSDDMGCLTRLILDMKASDELTSSIDEDDSEPQEDSDDVQLEDSETKLVPERVELLRSIVEHCRHFVSMVARPKWQLLALDIIVRSLECVPMDQDVLLPLVHQCWQPLKLLFNSDNLLLVSKAFSTLRIFAEKARDFIHQRTLRDVFPAMVQCLKKLRVIVEDRRNDYSLIARQSRQLLTQISLGLWEFMAQLNLNEEEVDFIISHMQEFVRLCDTYPELLGVKDAKRCLEPKRKMDADVLWLKQQMAT